MDLAQWWAEEARGEHYAPEGAESNGYSQLKIFHIFKIEWCARRAGYRCIAANTHAKRALLRSKIDITSRRDTTSLKSDLTPPKSDTPR